MQMRSMGVMPNCFTFPIVLKSCGKVNALIEGREAHCLVIKAGFEGDSFIGTTMIDMYSGGGAIGSAYRVFGKLVERNVIAWTSMINGYLLCGDVISARCLFDLASERDIVLWNTMVSGYIGCGDMVAARKLFDEMPNRDVMSWNTLLNGYASDGDLDACRALFEEMPERNVFSWNGLIGGYARSGHFLQVLSTFKSMLIEGNLSPNDVTLMNVLSACVRLGALDFGKWVHFYAESHGYGGNIYVANALIDMYAKCGIVGNAIHVFMSMQTKDLISWNTIINGLAIHGCAADALSMFQQMKQARVKPDAITFISVLCACSHMGLVDDGFLYFQSMIDDYSIVPQIEHYGCMVDLLARAGHLVQALEFVNRMPIRADAVIWTALLGACRQHKSLELAELAHRRLIELDPENPANYVVLSNIFGDAGKWKDVARLKVTMKDTGFRKLPGCSSIEVNDDFAEFYSLDERHPESYKIYEALQGLIQLLRSSVDVPDLIEFEQ